MDSRHQCRDPLCECSEGLSRRSFLKVGALSFLGLSLSEVLRAEAAEEDPIKKARQGKSCILLWMGGGPATQDIWDLKPDAPQNVRSAFQPIATNVNGIQICQHLPRMAQLMDKAVIIRSVTHSEGDHGRATQYMQTAYRPSPLPIQFPSLGSVVAKELGSSGMPPYITIMGGGYGPGFLGAQFNPVQLSDPNNPKFKLPGLDLPPGMTVRKLERRRALLEQVDELIRKSEPPDSVISKDKYYERAYTLITSDYAKKAFNLNLEPDAVRNEYGRTAFGQGALLARRLVEAGVRFITVGLGGWDTHSNNFPALQNNLLPQVDRGFSALLKDLDQRGLLQDTLVVWMGEFGRTPNINGNAGRDHWPQAMSVVLAGGGIQMGQVYGATDANAAYPTENPVSVEDLAATIYHALGIDYRKQYATPIGRGVRLSSGRHIAAIVS